MIHPLALLMIATALGGHNLSVECNVKDDPGVDAYVFLGTGPVHMRYGLCEDLAKPRETRKRAYAALVLAHELGHFRLNTSDEQKAECWGLAHVGRVARLLGWDVVATRRDARWWTFCGA